jgi:hypothetical protein
MDIHKDNVYQNLDSAQVSAKQQQQQQPPTARTRKSASRFKLTLRLLIATVSGVVVAIVAAVSTTVSTDTARNLGISLANSLVATAKIKSEEFFDIPVQHQLTITKMFKKPGVMFPTDNPAMTPDFFCDFVRPIFYASNLSYATMALIFEDKATWALAPVPAPHNSVMCFLSTFIAGLNNGLSVDSAVQYSIADHTRIKNPLRAPN